MKIPDTLGACADLLYTLREERLDAQRIVDDIACYEAEVRNHLIEHLPKSDATGVSGRIATARIVVKQVPQVTDWSALHNYLLEQRRLDLLQKRLSESGIRELWDDGQIVPGVVSFGAVSVSLTKAK